MFKLCVAVLVFACTQAFILDSIFGSPPDTVAALNLDKYIGRWFQMYASQSVVTLWENGAVCVTADWTYLGYVPALTLHEKRPDGSVSVLNSERIRNGSAGTMQTIHGYATGTNEPGKFTVHLETVPVGADYWVIKLGPETYNSTGLYQYAVVTDRIRGTLFVLARDPAMFNNDYDSEVTSFLTAQGFTTIVNKPIPTYHSTDCLYNTEHH